MLISGVRTDRLPAKEKHAAVDDLRHIVVPDPPVEIFDPEEAPSENVGQDAVSPRIIEAKQDRGKGDKQVTYARCRATIVPNLDLLEQFAEDSQPVHREPVEVVWIRVVREHKGCVQIQKTAGLQDAVNLGDYLLRMAYVLKRADAQNTIDGLRPERNPVRVRTEVHTWTRTNIKGHEPAAAPTACEGIIPPGVLRSNVQNGC